MENFLSPPEKVKGSLFDYHRKEEEDYCMHYYLVVNAITGRPQVFSRIFDGFDFGEQGMGAFMDADLYVDEQAPAEVYDRDTALYLIGQDAIHRSLCPHRLHDDVNDGPIFRLLPVFGAMIPNCVTLKKHNEKSIL